MRDPNCDTPSAVVKSISEHGGLNQYGKPFWRVILSDNHTRPKKGVWHKFADGSFEQFTHEGGGKFRHNPLHAISVVEEVRDTPLWPIPNQWIAERWFPAEVWGNPETWDKSSAYPEQGEYYLILQGPKEDESGQPMSGWQEMPSLHDIKQAISMWERNYVNRPRDFDMAYAMILAEDRAREEAEELKAREELEYFYRHELQPIFNGTSLEAQRLRNAAAESAGVKEHIGAGQ